MSENKGVSQYRLVHGDDESRIEKALREHVKIEWEKSLVE